MNDLIIGGGDMLLWFILNDAFLVLVAFAIAALVIGGDDYE